MTMQSRPVPFVADCLCLGYELLDVNFPACVSSRMLYFRGLAACCRVSRELGDSAEQHRAGLLPKGTNTEHTQCTCKM